MQTLTYSHLNAETNRIMGGTIDELIAWARAKHFVYHEKATRIIERLEYIFKQKDYLLPTDDNVDLETTPILGASGTGKTSIIKEFERIHAREHFSTHEGYPVRHCLMKDSITGLKGLYSALLSPYRHPYANNEVVKRQRITVDELEEVLLHMLRTSGTRIYFVDEFQHIIGRYQQTIINQLKRTMQVSGVPFVPVGIDGDRGVGYVLSLDEQLGGRCTIEDYSELNMLSLAENRIEEYIKFLMGYEKFLPFPEPSGLGEEDLARAIFDKVKFPNNHRLRNQTNLRRIAGFLGRASVRALTRGANKITVEIVNDTTF